MRLAIISVEIYDNRYLLITLMFLFSCSSLLDESICSEHGAGTSVSTYISLLHASMVVYLQDPFSMFHSIMVHTCKLLCLLILYDGCSKMIYSVYYTTRMSGPT